MLNRRLKIEGATCRVHMRTFFATSEIRFTAKPTVLQSAAFITDKQWARNVIEVSGLSESSDAYEVIILHAYPGHSILIESLLESYDHKQLAWEPRKLYEDHLNSLAALHGTKFAYSRSAFARGGWFRILDKVLPGDGTANYAAYHAKLVGNVPEMFSFIPKLVLSLAKTFHCHLSQFGVVEPILIVTGAEYRLMTEAGHFWQKTKCMRTAAYELFLRTELLGTVPVSAFNHTKSSASKSFAYDQTNLYVVRLTLRSDLDSVCSADDLVYILKLLKLVNQLKSHRIIPAMERFCPDIGIALLKLGISMMDRVRDVPLNTWPEIYRAATTSDQFHCSALYHIFRQQEATVSQKE